MDAAHAVEVACTVERQASHVEFVLDTGCAPQFEQARHLDSGKLGESAEAVSEQRVFKEIMACSYRRVRGKDAGGRRQFQCGIEVEAGAQAFAHAFEDRERRVALIDVPY